MEIRALGNRYGIAAFSLLTGATLFWLALRSDGCDWYISETHADAMFSGLRKFREYPFFSFVFDGGTYFLQDPQSNLFSPVVPLTLLVGPSVALRLLDGVWGCLGVWFFTLWMRRRVSVEAALLGGIANATSLGVLWRVAGGNDMFLWHLGLPALLWSAERLICERSVRMMAWFGLALGLLLLGPTFCSFMFLFLPVVPVVMLAEWLAERPNPRQLARTVLFLFGACLIAALIASPKLLGWLAFSMKRPVNDYGPIPLRTAVWHLFDFSISKQHIVLASAKQHGMLARGAVRGARGWGEEETAVALQPAAAILALVGFVSSIWLKKQRRTGALAFVLVALGLTLSCSWFAFDVFRYIGGGGFRVVQRFLAISGFGLAVLAALGADALLTKLRSFRSAFTVCTGLMVVCSVVWWTWSASHFTGATTCDAVHSVAIRPLARFKEERAWVDGFTSYGALRKFPGLGRDFLKGDGFTDGFLIVGNDFDPKPWASKNALPIVAEGAGNSGPVIVRHSSMVITHLKPNSWLAFRVREPKFGLAMTTVPPNAKVKVFQHGKRLDVENQSDQEIESVTLRAQLPFSRLWFAASAFGLIGAILLIAFSTRQKAYQG
jgi:hypothetical protein